MSIPQTQSGFAAINNAQIYYETAGRGQPLVMIHAGVADSRQWNNEFAFFARDYHVVRYDLRCYGKSEPVDGDFSHMNDLVSLLDALGLHDPLVLMGCSMGGSLAMDFALTHPSRAKALIMVGSGPSGLKLDVPAPPKFAEAEKAFEAGEWERLAELETEIWFDGAGRQPGQVDQEMRRLCHAMIRQALAHEAKQLGNRIPNTEVPAFERLAELKIPVLIVVGAHDTPYILAAADYMRERIPSSQRAIIADAAHLPNMDHPEEFRAVIAAFLEKLPR